MADIYIRASELRPKLGNSIPHDWRVVELRELCKCKTDNDAKRVVDRNPDFLPPMRYERN
jgi:hypothetical protein